MLSDEVRNALKAAACDLALKKWDTMRIESDVISGIIKTNWDTHIVGGRSGVLFRAHIDCEDGTDYCINFLLQEDDLARGSDIIREMEKSEDGEWSRVSARIPCEALYHFENLRGPSRKLH